MIDHRRLGPEDYDNPHPVYLVWELTLQCDQACRHCGSRAGRARANELTTDEALAVAAQISGLGIREVTLIGGESYLRPDWLAVARAVADAGIRCSLVTGGRDFHLDRARAAAAAGITSVSVSIDGLEETHDRLRAVPGSWRAALAALEATRQAKMVATVNTQVNRANLGELDALADVLLGGNGGPAPVRAWQVQLTTPMGRASEGDALILQPYDLLDLVPALARLARRARGADCLLLASDNVGYFGPHEAELRPGGHWGGCTAGAWTLGLASDGTVKGCASLPIPPYQAENVREAPLADIVARSASLRSLRDRTVDDLWGHCRTCYYAAVCLGGCTWTGHVILGSPGNMPYCHHRALELKDRGRRERLDREGDRWVLVEEDWPAEAAATAGP